MKVLATFGILAAIGGFSALGLVIYEHNKPPKPVTTVADTAEPDPANDDSGYVEDNGLKDLVVSVELTADGTDHHFVKFLNKGETPIRITRVVINKRPLCDSDVRQPDDENLFRAAKIFGFFPTEHPFVAKINNTLNLGDSIATFATDACGQVIYVDVYSDQGDLRYTFK